MIVFKIIVYIYLIAPFVLLMTILLDKIVIKKQKKYKVKEYVDIYVLLPALKEQKIVKETIDWFKNIKYKGNIKYVIVTTEKEENEFKKNNIKSETTNKVVSKYLKKIKDNRFLHFHYPKTEGNKSSQMNYAILQLKSKNMNLDNTYISVFDFDSRPEKTTFDELNKVIQNKNKPDMVQQIPLAIKNYSEMTNKSIIMTIYSLQHMVRSLAIEKFKFQISTLLNVNVPKYFMGACMHLKLSTLIQYDLFPIFVDDLTLGYRYSIYGKKCEYLYTPNYSLIPNDLKGYFSSSTLIFKGILTYLSEIKKAKKHFINKFKMAIAGTANIFEFCIIPYMFLSYYIYIFLTRNFTLFNIATLLIPVLWSLSSYIELKVIGIKNDNKLRSLLAILLSFIWFCFRPIGFIKYSIKKVKNIILKKEIIYTKTER